MKQRFCFASTTRISDLNARPFTLQKLAKEHWETGDYVAGEVVEICGRQTGIELTNGRMSEVAEGDIVIGAFGRREATLEAVGDWRDIGENERFEMMTAAGLFGKITSCSIFLKPPLTLKYCGHVLRSGNKVKMSGFVREYGDAPFLLPVVLLIGTSMSAGKTTAGKIICHQLKQAGYDVIGAKFTGAARFRDSLAFKDAGAEHIFDFVDMGLPSSICEPEHYRKLLRNLLARISQIKADVLVAEAGASPLEPYNGSIAVEELERNVRCTVLCASDPYAVVGVSSAFGRKPDIISGAAANTSASIALVEKLTGARPLNLQDKSSMPQLREILSRNLQFNLDG